MMEFESLMCPVCLEVMCDPVMLPLCGHSLCRVCLASIRPQPPCCPICRTEHHGPNPQKLPTNFCIAYLTSCHHQVEDKISSCKEGSTVMEIPSAPSFSSVVGNHQEISLDLKLEDETNIGPTYTPLQSTKSLELSHDKDKNLAEETHIEPTYTPLQSSKSLELSHDKVKDSNPFSCIHALQLVVITFIIMSLIFTYGWMILDWVFNITQKNYNYFEKLYLLIFGCFGILKFSHQVYRFFKGNPSNFEISLFFHYFVFDIVWILVGLFFEVNIEVLLRVVIPACIIIGFSISVSALSVTTLPLSPEMKASSGCAKFVGYIFLGLSISGFLGCFLTMIIIGSIRFSSYEQLYLIVAGACGFQTTLHGSYRLINGKIFQYENYMLTIYLVIHSIWFLIGLSGVVPTTSLIFWMSNVPFLTILVMSILISSQSLTPALLYCCANTYNAL